MDIPDKKDAKMAPDSTAKRSEKLDNYGTPERAVPLGT